MRPISQPRGVEFGVHRTALRSWRRTALSLVGRATFLETYAGRGSARNLYRLPHFTQRVTTGCLAVNEEWE
jgi:hypothetical protein